MSYLPRELDLRGPERPIEALDLHLAQWEWTESAAHEWWVTKFGEMFAGSRERPREAAVFAAQISSVEKNVLNGKTTFVTPEITQQIVEMAEAGDNPVLKPWMVPDDTGFVIFGVPIPYLDFDYDLVVREGYESMTDMPIRAVGWQKGVYDGKGEESVAFTLYIDSDLSRAAPGHPEALPSFGQIMKDEWGHAPPLGLMDFFLWNYDVEWEFAENLEERSKHKQAPHIGMMRRQMAALWKFMAEQITPLRPPRAQRRRAERSGMDTPEDGTVNIVHLRAIKGWPSERIGSGGHTEVEWSHRWIVRPHYRRIADKDNPGQHKFVYIREHEKGPKEKPLVIKEKVFSVDR
jgi:hypothetical protein